MAMASFIRVNNGYAYTSCEFRIKNFLFLPPTTHGVDFKLQWSAWVSLRLPRNLSSNNVAVARNCCLCFRTIINASFSCLVCLSLASALSPSTNFSACRTATISDDVNDLKDLFTLLIGPSPESMEDEHDVDADCRMSIFVILLPWLDVIPLVQWCPVRLLNR